MNANITPKELALTFIIGAFSYVAGMAWRDTIQSIFERYLPTKGGSTVIANLIYATIVTILSVTVIILLSKNLL